MPAMLRRGNKFLSERRAARSCRYPVVVIISGLVIAIIFLYTRNRGENSVIEERVHYHASEILQAASLPNPTAEYTNGTEVIWQIPPHPKAVLFVAHGCGGSARNFWPSCPSCPNCVGLPEESRIIRDALDRKYAVLVISSADECWSYGKERSRVKEIVRFWLKKNDLVKLPLVGLGASSGGYFLSILANEVKFRGIVLMIASGLFDRMVDIPPDYPPTLFVHMPKDINRRRKVDRHIEILRKAGIEVHEIKCVESPLTPNWLADRIAGLDQATSSKLFKVLSEKGFIDANGYMKNDGRVTPWREALQEKNIDLPYESALKHKIQEELNLAYAYHEMTSLQSNQIFEWLEAQIR